MVKNILKQEIKNLVHESIEATKLIGANELSNIQIEISRTKNPDHGQFSCNIALSLSKKLGLNAVDLLVKLLKTLIIKKVSRKS